MNELPNPCVDCVVRSWFGQRAFHASCEQGIARQAELKKLARLMDEIRAEERGGPSPVARDGSGRSVMTAAEETRELRERLQLALARCDELVATLAVLEEKVEALTGRPLPPPVARYYVTPAGQRILEEEADEARP